jgi:hypothetical protein
MVSHAFDLEMQKGLDNNMSGNMFLLVDHSRNILGPCTRHNIPISIELVDRRNMQIHISEQSISCCFL